jgi:hypothetical protein
MGRKGLHVGIDGKARRKEPLRRPRSTWVENAKMDLREIGWGGMN